MTDVPLVHVSPAGGGAAAFVLAVAGRLGVDASASVTERRTYLDTFDWRLHRAGWTLHAVIGAEPARASEAADGVLLVVEPLVPGGGPTRRGRADRVPDSVDELGTGWFASVLSAGAGRRLLVPVVTVTVASWTMERRNREGKLLAKVVVESSDGGSVARVAGVRGYDAARDEVAAAVAAEAAGAGWEPSGASLVDLLVADAGHDPAAPDVPLDPQMPAALAYVAVLQRLLQVLRATEAGTRQGDDIEFLHDYRVAVRRTRSALRHAKGVLPAELLACFRPEFGWLQEATGPVRDLDVYLEELADDRAALAADRAADLDAVAEVLQSRHDAAQETLAADIGSPRATALLSDWADTLAALAADEAAEGEEAGEWGEWPGSAAEPIAHVVADRIVRQYRKLVDDGRRIGPQSPAEDLHDLRKSGKELRYLFELFGSALPAATASAVVKDLKGLQDCLGRFQDTQIQQTLLTELSLELVAEDRATHGALLGIGGLVDRLEQRRAAARSEFADRFAAFAATPVLKQIAALAHRPEGDR